MKLDMINRKILFELENNAKTSLKHIAKKCRISREVANYRIKKLEEKQIIKAYIAKINPGLFYSGTANLVIKLSHINQKRHNQIIKYLYNHKNIKWFGELCGTYDLVISFLYRDTKNLSKITDEITLFIGKDIQTYNLSIYVKEYKFTRSGILKIKEKNYFKEDKIVFENQNKIELKLDKKDLIILHELSVNCKIKNSILAKKINLSEDMVRLRIKKLEKQKIIFGYTINLNPYIIGFEGYSLYLQIENITKDFEKKINNYVNSNPYIYFTVKMVGKYNYIIGIYAKNRNHFKELLLDIKEFFKDSLKDYEFQLLLNEHKEVFIAEDLLKNNNQI